MSMTVVVTRDVPDRFRGFLASCMLEIAPGVYTSPRMTKAVRDRAWSVCADWYAARPSGSVLMTWKDDSSAGGQGLRILGAPAKDLCEHEGVVLARRPLPAVTTEEHSEGGQPRTSPIG